MVGPKELTLVGPRRLTVVGPTGLTVVGPKETDDCRSKGPETTNYQPPSKGVTQLVGLRSLDSVDHQELHGPSLGA